MPMSSVHILLVEDDKKLGSLLKDFLESHDYAVTWTQRGLEVGELLERHTFDLIVLDWMLPDLDGIIVCRQIRPSFAGPILMLTARHGDENEIAALGEGSDDYLAKPVRPSVLIARIKALLRRAERQDVSLDAGLISNRQTGSVFEVADLRIEPSKRSVLVENRIVDLTTAEYDLLWLLAKNAGQVLSRDEMYLALRGMPYDGIDRSIDLRTSRIRTKLGDDPKGNGLIKTIRGVGYMMVSA